MILPSNMKHYCQIKNVIMDSIFDNTEPEAVTKACEWILEQQQ